MYIEFDTKYNHYSVADVVYNGRMARVLYSGSHDAAQSGMPLDGKPGLLFDYIQAFMDLLEGITPKSVLMLGGGAFTLPSAILRRFPGIRLDVVELDGELVEVAERFFDFTPSEQTTVHVADARTFIDETTDSFDMIIVDVFTHDAMPSSLLTAEAAAALQRCLTRKGLLAVNVIASIDGRQAGPLRRIHANLQAIFPDVTVFPAAHGLSSWAAQNFIVAAQFSQRDLSEFMCLPAVNPTGT